MATLTCPVEGCGRVLDLTQKPGDAARLIGNCVCGRFGGREVVEVDDPPAAAAPGLAELIALPGVSIEIARALEAVGLGSVAAIAAASDETLLAVSGLGPATLKKIRASSREQGA